MSSREWESLIGAVRRLDDDLHVLEPSELDEKVTAATDAFVSNPKSAWWWTSLRGRVRKESYEGHDVFAILESRIPVGDPVVLLVTNEAAKPEGGLSGPLGSIIAVMRDTIGFEFALMSPTLDWIVFDTHRNSLVWSRPVTG